MKMTCSIQVEALSSRLAHLRQLMVAPRGAQPNHLFVGHIVKAAIGTSDSSIRMPAKRLASQGVPGSCSRSQGSTRNVWRRVAKRVSQNHPQPCAIPFQVAKCANGLQRNRRRIRGAIMGQF
ncbi:hypothetical protein CTI12_AA613830 [Artemisia annua]|uniref:Uncharacterized protein n=1 Tax=Artemisia annua TaxID=35608 RepID=A0A2U1KDX6_ARTAN|nr:hypothetical protein CTI12_AA613830 [Artemisia annua]